MQRRRFLQVGGMSAAAMGLAACTGSAVDDDTAEASEAEVELAQEAAGDDSLPEIEWEMPTSWPLGLDTIYGGAVTFAERVEAMTGGRFRITPRAAGELVPALEILQAVESGATPIGHTASYYYTGRSPVMGLGTSVPFGLNYRAQNAWLYEGEGLAQLRDFYAENFGVIQFPAGNTGTQMGGWFNTEITSVGDLQGLTMRIPGLGGEVMSRLGVTVQVIAGGEIFQALDTGAVDAAEWVGPYDDLQLGFQDAARFYYYPGWWEPGPTLEVQISLQEWEQLPSIYQEIVETAAHQANQTMMARYDVRNPQALQEIVAAGTELRQYPQDVLDAGRTAAFELYEEFAANDAAFGEIFEGWNAFRQQIEPWFALAELATLQSAADASEGS